MEKHLIFFAPIMSIFVLSVIIVTYFIEDIFNHMKLAGINFSTMPQNPDFQILLCLGLVGFIGIVGIHRNKGNN